MTVTERDNGILTVKVQGRVDGANADKFQDEVKTAVGEDDKAVLLDMVELAYISSAGLRSVLLIAKMLEKQGVRFMIHSLSDPIRDIFEISGFDKIIEVRDSHAKAMESL